MIKFVTLPYDFNGHLLERLSMAYIKGSGVPALTSRALPEEMVAALVASNAALNATGRRVSTNLLSNIKSLQSLHPDISLVLQGKARLNSSDLLQELSTLSIFLENINTLISEGATDDSSLNSKTGTRVDAEWFKKLYAKWESIKFLDFIGNSIVISEDASDPENMTTLERLLNAVGDSAGPSSFIDAHVNRAHIAAFNADNADAQKLNSDPFSTLKVMWTSKGSGMTLCDPILTPRILDCIQWSGEAKSSDSNKMQNTTVDMLAGILTACTNIDSCLYALNSAPHATKWISDSKSGSGSDSNKLLRSLASEAQRLQEYLYMRFYVSMSMPISILSASVQLLANDTVLDTLQTCYPRLTNTYNLKAAISALAALPGSPTMARLLKDVPYGGTMNVSGESLPLHFVPSDAMESAAAPNYINRAAASLAAVIPSLDIISKNKVMVDAYMKGAVICGAMPLSLSKVALRNSGVAVNFASYGDVKMGAGIRSMTGMQLGFTYESGLNALGGSELSLHYLSSEVDSSGFVMPFSTAQVDYMAYRRSLGERLEFLKGGSRGNVMYHSGVTWNKYNIPTVILDLTTTTTMYQSAIFDRSLLFNGPSSMLPFGLMDNRVVSEAYESEIIKKEVVGKYSIPLENVATEVFRIAPSPAKKALKAKVDLMSAALNISSVALSLMVASNDEARNFTGDGLSLSKVGLAGINGAVLKRFIHPDGAGSLVCGTVTKSHFFAMPLTSILWIPGFHISGHPVLHIVDAYAETGPDVFGAIVNSIQVPYYQKLSESITSVQRVRQSVIGSSPIMFSPNDRHTNINALVPDLTGNTLPTVYEQVERDAIRTTLS